ncbi:MAG: M23 family metallopeptidase [Caldilineaceae bacterium]|nr:M23 family metallopeptidase [Caldilineaceae bacterium]
MPHAITMPPVPNEPLNIYGLHDAGGEHLFEEADVHGWVVFNEFIGMDAADRSGVDYSAWSERGYGVIVKLQLGFNPEGTLPAVDNHLKFARRCGRFVKVSRGCRHWVIGNEFNNWAARPGADARVRISLLKDVKDPAQVQAVLRALPERFDALHPDGTATNLATVGEAVHPDRYVACFRQCREAIRQADPDALVITGAVTPWNTHTRYAGNENGDWITYFSDILNRLGPQGCDGIALHAFTVTDDPADVTADAWIPDRSPRRRSGFRAYRDFMRGIPYHMRQLPAYIVEADQFQSWSPRQNGWVQAVFREINGWNEGPGHQQIRCAALFRWAASPGGRWQLSASEAALADTAAALNQHYAWDPQKAPLLNPEQPDASASLSPGSVVRTIGDINLRAVPGFVGSPPDAIVTKLPSGQQCLIVDGPEQVDRLIWWRVTVTVSDHTRVDGWLAQAGVDAQPFIARVSGAPDLAAPFDPVPIPDTDTMAPGTYFLVQRPTELRRTPGTRAKEADDLLGTVPVGTPGIVQEGPLYVEDSIWWRVRAAWPEGGDSTGWLREETDRNQRNLQVIAVPGTPALPEPRFAVGDTVWVWRNALLRRLPGISSQAVDDIVMQLAPGMSLTVEGGPRMEDRLVWWQVATPAAVEPVLRGWVSDMTSTGYDLLQDSAPDLPGRDRQALQPGDNIWVIAASPMRRTPGLDGDAGYDVLGEVPRNTLCTVLGHPQGLGGVPWWLLAVATDEQDRMWGWVAQTAPDGTPQMGTNPLPAVSPPVPRRAPSARERRTFANGDRVMNIQSDVLRIRRTPGHVGKPDSDIIGRAPSRSTLLVHGGPEIRDNLRWWRTDMVIPPSNQPSGWVAEGSQSGLRLLAYDFLADHIDIATPFPGRFPMSQGWGTNPQFYSRFTYGGVPMRGHNGLDFALPVGTPLLATDAGRITRTDFGVGGFGKFVLMEHDWGESVYAHMSEFSVSVGQTVGRGATLGLSGNTGASTGPHLHFGIRILPYRRPDGWGGFCNPAQFMSQDIFRNRPVAMEPSPPGVESDSNVLP